MTDLWLTPEVAAAARFAAGHPEFVTNWARLRGIPLPTTPLDSLIDAASGHGEATARRFLLDVKDLICDRLTPEEGA
jgi:hypothetical protein